MIELRPMAGQARWTRVILRWAQVAFMLVGFVAIGYYGYVQSERYLFQSYQSWRLDQLQQGRPASIALYLGHWLSTSQNPDAALKGKSLQLKKSWPRPGSRACNPGRRGGSDPSVKMNGIPGDISEPTEGSLVGRLKIPRLDVSAVVLEGVQPKTLRVAVGHLSGTPLPGEPGNVDVAGHRDTFFRGLRKIQKGDLITFSTLSGKTYQYRVASLAVVSPNSTDILNASPGTGLNLITCFPFYYVGPAPKRFIVHAVEVNDPAGAAGHRSRNRQVRSGAASSWPLMKVGFDQNSDRPLTALSNASNARTLPRLSHNQATGTSGILRGPQSLKAKEDSTGLLNIRDSSGTDPQTGTTIHHSRFGAVGGFFRKLITLGRSPKERPPANGAAVN
jgi:LPXTG-site transpeptidase (sortase) family protein